MTIPGDVFASPPPTPVAYPTAAPVNAAVPRARAPADGWNGKREIAPPRQPAETPKSEARIRREKEKKAADFYLNFVIVVGLLMALVPQLFFITLVALSPGFLFTDQTFHQMMLFTTTSNATAVIVVIASIVYARAMGRQLDQYDELLARGYDDFNRFKSMFAGWGYDIESMSPLVNRTLDFYHTNKREMHIAFALSKRLVHVIPALERKYGKRLENWDTLNPEEQDEIVKTIFRRDM